MRTRIFKLNLITMVLLVFFSCSKEENNSTINNSNNEVVNTQRTIASLPTNFFKPKNNIVKGIVVLGSGNNPQDPTPGQINDPYLIALCKELASKGFACAIVAYRDQPYVGANFENFNSNSLMLVTDFNNVGNELITEFNLSRSRVVFGGSSYSANCLISQNAWGNAMLDIKGITGIMGSCALDTAKNQKTPVLAFACNGEPFGTQYGLSLVQSIINANVKSASYGFTDVSCNGHATSNQWISSIAEKINAWIP